LIPLTPPRWRDSAGEAAAGRRWTGIDRQFDCFSRGTCGRRHPRQTPLTNIATLPAESDGTLTVAPLIRPTPDWVEHTDGRRIVTHTKPILQGDDSESPLAAAINEALAQHIASVTETMNPALHDQTQFVRMELPRAAAKKCVVDTFDRWETMSTETEGEKSFLIRYALLEFPEDVDQMAVRRFGNQFRKIASPAWELSWAASG